MAAITVANSSGKCPLTRGLRLWVDPEASWAAAGGPYYVNVAP